MLRRLSLKQFKCFKELSLPLAQLTLLSGRNAVGKSTVLQALALLHQSRRDPNPYGGLPLTGSVISLGTASDVLNKIWGRDEIEIGLEADDFACVWTFEAESRQDLTLAFKRVRWPGWESAEGKLFESPIQSLTLVEGEPDESFAMTFFSLLYVSAERLGPREVYPLGTPQSHFWVGTRGERTVGMLNDYGSEPVNTSGGVHRIIAEVGETLFLQTQAWLGRFFPGAQLELRPVPAANMITLGLRTSEETDFHRPQNVGYGLTHILPILAACLFAPSGRVVVIENPEAHLHPAGQALMGEFLARVAADGVQILVETHSDHVLNGIRRAVRSKLLTPSNVALHFFSPRTEPPDPSVPQLVSPTMDENGQLDAWPSGFFDQFDKDMNILAGWGQV